MKAAPKNICVINFESKSFRKVHVSSAFSFQDVILQLPELLQTYGNISVPTMKLTKTSWNRTLNQKRYRWRHIYYSVILSSFIINTLHSDCKSFSYRVSHHQHIVTGNLRVISNCKLRKLSSNCLYYRGNKTINYKKSKSPISKDFLSCRYNLTKDTYTVWYDTIKSNVEERIFHVMVKLKFQQTKPILQDEEVLDWLNNSHEKFVVVPIGKTCNNVSSVCIIQIWGNFMSKNTSWRWHI